MTFLAAQRFGQRLIMVADTKITDPAGVIRNGQSSRNNNYIPGRLKAFPLSLKISVGYAGISAIALRAIRRAAVERDISTDLAGVIELLQESSADSRVDYLIASHVNGPQIFKIKDGVVSNDQLAHWIGDREVVPLFQDSITQRKLEYQQSLNYGCQDLARDFDLDEMHFVSSWTRLLLNAPTLTQSVGGFPVCLLGSPYGHCFQISAGACNGTTVHFLPDGTWLNEDGQVVLPLYGQYSFSLVDSKYRGAPVLGVWLQETKTAYLYDPLTNDDPQCLPSIAIESLSEIVSNRAKELGGQMVE